MAWRVGVDIGGTFADFAALDTETGRMQTLKVLTTPGAPGQDVGAGLARLVEAGLQPAQVERFVYGTTVGVNTIIQRRGAGLALFTTAGFTDVLELARLRMPDPYSLFCERPEPLVPREHVFPIEERMDAEGATVTPPGRASVAAAVAAAQAAGCAGIVVSFLHAWRNPAHEEQVAAMIAELAPELFVFRGSEVWPAIREYERSTTAVLNAYVHPRIDAYLERVEAQLAAAAIAAPLLLTTSAGGTMTAQRGRRDCVGMLLSGTASGVVGAGVVARAAGVPAVLTLDIGGTSADVALLIDGSPAFGTGHAIGEFPLAIPTVAVVSSGQGGGSIARIDALGVLQVGPESAGSTPGPACFGRGGQNPTVTDAALLCGILGQGELGFGAIAPDKALSEAAIAPIATALGSDAATAAEGVLRVAISGMLVEIDKLLARAGIGASELTLMPFGGAGPMLGALLAETAGIRRVLVPPVPGTLCALGALAADLRRDTMRTVLLPLEDAAWARLDGIFRELADEAATVLREMGGDGGVDTTLAADLRYRGQSYELTVPVPAAALGQGVAGLAALFHAAHEESFGHSDPDAPVEVVSLRAAARRPAPPLPMPRQTLEPHEAMPEAAIRLRLDGAWREAGLHRRTALRPGGRFAGPAIVTQSDCTVLVPGGWTATTDELGNLVMEHA
ncbi:hydantoinase/oxoprolinase family protein [Roseomonas aerophila]|uniref:Hydantoinase/oxoprolinase family protein n=1 Tax=Teichococcus aerophilus TaxID=1224513 RepID=A0ABR7RFP1_9PROT|nr:hydantoinase/oxoprolinase family protein [Pseudoroseomonas aerophila]MBC9205379.1 hydantoinase/oxoprolinase family protein [Pseudoroseomonas aerophila]